MKIEKKLNTGILALALRIQEKYPELAFYFRQMPEAMLEESEINQARETGNENQGNKERVYFSVNGRFPV